MAEKNKKRSPRARKGYIAKTRPSATGGQVYVKQGNGVRQLRGKLTEVEDSDFDAYIASGDDDARSRRAIYNAKIRNRKKRDKK